MRRRKVNWDEEIKKSEEIRRKGLRLTLVTFLMALFWLLGMDFFKLKGAVNCWDEKI